MKKIITQRRRDAEQWVMFTRATATFLIINSGFLWLGVVCKSRFFLCALRVFA